MLDILHFVSTLIGLIETIIGSMVVVLFVILSWENGFAWAWDQMFRGPWRRMRSIRRWKHADELYGRLYPNGLVTYAEADVEATMSLYRGNWTPPEEGDDPLPIDFDGLTRKKE